MKIVCITILDDNYEQIYFNALDSNLNARHMLTITSFVNALNDMGGEHFRQNFDRIDLKNLWFEFLTLNDYNVLLIIKVDPITVMKEMRRINSYIEKLHEYLISIVDKPDFTLSKTNYINIFTNLLKLHLQINKYNPLGIMLEEENYTYEVAGIIVAEPTGIPILYKMYTQSKYADPVLLSGMLSSVNNFSNIEFNKQIQRIFLEEDILYFHQEELLYVVILNLKSNHPKSIPLLVEEKMGKLLRQLSNTIDWLYNESPDEEIYKIMDECVSQVNFNNSN